MYQSFQLTGLKGDMRKKTKKFLVDYHHDNADWSFEIDAYDWNDARERVKKLCYARVAGTNIHNVPFIGLAVYIYIKVINQLKGRVK